MNDRAQPGPSSPQEEGGAVRITRRNGAGHATVLYLVLALLLIAGSAGYILSRCHHSPQPPADSAPPKTSARDRAIAADVPKIEQPADAAARPIPPRDTTATGGAITPRRTHRTPAAPRAPTGEQGAVDGDPTLDLSAFVPRGQAPSISEVIEQLHNAGIYSGIGAFSPPGTSPPLVGLAVPDDFELPEGYVRHFQATDDGQRIEPILMFSPDYEFLDAKGRPIEIPETRVVPPELAPPGLPIRQIEIPAPQDPGDRSR